MSDLKPQSANAALRTRQALAQTEDCIRQLRVWLEDLPHRDTGNGQTSTLDAVYAMQLRQQLAKTMDLAEQAWEHTVQVDFQEAV